MKMPDPSEFYRAPRVEWGDQLDTILKTMRKDAHRCNDRARVRWDSHSPHKKADMADRGPKALCAEFVAARCRFLLALVDGPRPQAELPALLRRRKATVQGMGKRLQQDGCVALWREKGRTWVEITEEGREFLEAHDALPA